MRLFSGLGQQMDGGAIGWAEESGVGVGDTVSWGQVELDTQVGFFLPRYPTPGRLGRHRDSVGDEPGGAGAACPDTGVDPKYGHTQAPARRHNPSSARKLGPFAPPPPPPPIQLHALEAPPSPSRPSSTTVAL